MNSALVDIIFQRQADFIHQFNLVDEYSTSLDLTGWFIEAAVSATKETYPPDYIFSSANGGIEETDLAAGMITLVLAKQSIIAGTYYWDLVGIDGLKRKMFAEGSFTAAQRGVVTMSSVLVISGGLTRVSVVKQGTTTRVVTGGTLLRHSARKFDTETAANLADIDSVANNQGKFEGRAYYDVTNDRLMVANGALPASTWSVADGSASVTPS